MITEGAVPAYNKQFKQLVGSKILDFKMVQCEFDPHQYWPTFSMQLADQKYKLVLSQDEEGNGGGFAFIEQESMMFEMEYECECGEVWSMEYECICNDRCPSCRLENEPVSVEDV